MVCENVFIGGQVVSWARAVVFNGGELVIPGVLSGGDFMSQETFGNVFGHFLIVVTLGVGCY